MKKCNIITLYERKARNNYLAFLSAVMLLAFNKGRRFRRSFYSLFILGYTN